jgi:hypothetical protein
MRHFVTHTLTLISYYIREILTVITLASFILLQHVTKNGFTPRILPTAPVQGKDMPRRFSKFENKHFGTHA